jgi:hypothetical protein
LSMSSRAVSCVCVLCRVARAAHEAARGAWLRAGGVARVRARCCFIDVTRPERGFCFIFYTRIYILAFFSVCFCVSVCFEVFFRGVLPDRWNLGCWLEVISVIAYPNPYVHNAQSFRRTLFVQLIYSPESTNSDPSDVGIPPTTATPPATVIQHTSYLPRPVTISVVTVTALTHSRSLAPAHATTHPFPLRPSTCLSSRPTSTHGVVAFLRGL